MAWALAFAAIYAHAADVVFPADYERIWNEAGPGPVEKAQAVLAAAGGRAAELVKGQPYSDVTAILATLKDKIYGNRHESFTPDELMQRMRFVWLKTYPEDAKLMNRQQPVRDFLFDPAIAPNTEVPKNGVKMSYQPSKLKIVIIGGGPGGLTTAVTLAEKAGPNVEIHVYEARWADLGGGKIGFPPTARRRDQIVTLQDSVTGLFDTKTREALFGPDSERIWPAAQNIQIRKVEDRLLARAKDYPGIIHLHPEAVVESNLDKVGDFHYLLGADGAGSWLRKTYFQDQAVAKRAGYGMGMGFARRDGLPQSEPLSIFLTLAQTRYLINGSNNEGTGYVAIHLTEKEWNRTTLKDGTPCTFGNPACLLIDGKVPAGFNHDQAFPPALAESDPFWVSMRDGLTLYGFHVDDVRNIMRIPVSVTGVKDPVVPMSAANNPTLNRPQGLVGILGDAAITVHWWPGRGMNTAIKTAVGMGDELAEVANAEKTVGMKTESVQPFIDFITRLQIREHDGRSFPVLNQTGDPQRLQTILNEAPSSIAPAEAMEILVKRVLEVAKRLEDRPDWPYEKVPDLEKRVREVLKKLSPITLQEMAHSGPWPTKLMSGPEVHPPRTNPCSYGAVVKKPFEKRPSS